MSTPANRPPKPKKQKSAGKLTLSNGRPPFIRKSQASLSKQATRNLITSHHILSKQLAGAEAQQNTAEADKLRKQIQELGGLQSYQQASIQGQSESRGGDSSLVLLQWFKDVEPALRAQEQKIRMLEVGALSTRNACSRSGLFEMQRIDLHAQSAEILQQDFMARPVPKSGPEGEGKFDTISLSLVLNFVPSAEGRGEMLKHTCQFLDRRTASTMPDALRAIFPALFLVLPAACVANSRYMDDERLTLIMGRLGYVLLRRKQTAKLVYYLWRVRDDDGEPGLTAKEAKGVLKKEVHAGVGRNNFSIVLR